MMANYKSGKFTSIRNDWETPDDLFAPLEDEFLFEIDVCATDNNTKCVTFYSEEENGLLQDWSIWRSCWMNPPFNNNKEWVIKAYNESLKGVTVVCLVPARTNTNWWHDYCMKGEVRFIRGRPIFKGATGGLPQPLAIVIFRGTK